MSVYPPIDSYEARPKAVRGFFLGLGLLCTGLGVVGTILPVMPGTVFFIIALWSFSKSSPRMENWLLEHPTFGGGLRNWRRDRSMTLRSKILAIGLIWAGIGFSIWMIPNTVARLALALTAVALTAYLSTRKTAL